MKDQCREVSAWSLLMPIEGINQSNWNYYLTVCMPPLTIQAAGYIYVCVDSCNICSEDLKNNVIKGVSWSSLY